MRGGFSVYQLLWVVAVVRLFSNYTLAEAPATTQSVGMCQRVDLFEAGQNGYTTFRIPGIVVTHKGTILITASARSNGWGDWVDIDTVMRRSTDNGRTWLPSQLINDDGKNTCENACMIADGDRVYMIYMVNYAKCYLRSSGDEGATWSEPRDITSVFDTYKSRDHWNWTVAATGPGHGIVLKSGRFVIPVWLSTDHSHRPSVTTTIVSDDKGATWQAGDVVTLNLPESKNPSENVCLEMADGRVMDNIRCESTTHRRLVAYSPDGATHWTKPMIDENLFEPVCFASMVRYSLPVNGQKNRILFCNPDSAGAGAVGNKANMFIRKNVTARLSYDDGKTWPVSKVIDPGESGYSDLAVAPDGSIYLAYERGGTNGEKVFSSKYFSVVHFDLAWLTGNSDNGK